MQNCLPAVEQNFRVENLHGQVEAGGLGASIQEKLVPAIAQSFAQLQIGRVRTSEDSSYGPAPQKPGVFGAGAADDAPELEPAIRFDDERIAAPTGQGLKGSKTAEFAVLTVGDQVFGCCLQGNAFNSWSVAGEGWRAKSSIEAKIFAHVAVVLFLAAFGAQVES
jgi:hypothetical protein